jgi:hypothetical protein
MGAAVGHVLRHGDAGRLRRFHGHASTSGCRQHRYRQGDQKRYNGSAEAHGWACVKIAGCSRSWSSDDFASDFQLLDGPPNRHQLALNARARRFRDGRFDLRLTRRSALVAIASLLQARVAFAAQEPLITVHKDPSCGCCSGWVQHLRKAGFVTKVFDAKDIDAVKKRLGVPDDLAACHTAEVAGLCHRGPHTRRGAVALPCPETECEGSCRSRHADRLARDGGRQARKIRCGSVWAGWAADIHELCRRTERLSGSLTASRSCSGG